MQGRTPDRTRGMSAAADRCSVSHAASQQLAQPTLVHPAMARNPPKCIATVLRGTPSQRGTKCLCDRVARDLGRVRGGEIAPCTTVLPHGALKNVHLPLGDIQVPVGEMDADPAGTTDYFTRKRDPERDAGIATARVPFCSSTDQPPRLMRAGPHAAW